MTKRQAKKAVAKQNAQAEETLKATEVTVENKAEELKETVAEKAEEVKEAAAAKVSEVKDAAEEKAAEVKEAAGQKVKEAKKAVGKKTADVKKAVKKAAVKKEIKTEIVLQYGEKEVNTKDMVAAVKKEWTKAKHKVSDIKSMELYVKPEDYAVYYVINGDTTGKVWL
ncbi:DUF6465 family protein [Roseburia hominis]